MAKKRAAKRKPKKLPKGLEEFKGSLWGEKWTLELLRRLLDLPDSGHILKEIEAWRLADEYVYHAENALRVARIKANTMAVEIFERCAEKYTIKQLQDATGYDDY